MKIHKLNTKMIMTAAASFLALSGILLSFLPDEIMMYLHVAPNQMTRLCLQLLSAFYLSYGILNWSARHTLLGGIYNRPIVLGNFMHFFVGSIALLKMIPKITLHRNWLVLIAATYLLFALSFGFVFRSDPVREKLEK